MKYSFEGPAIPFELARLVNIPLNERPYVEVFSTDPDHKGGIDYVLVKPDSLVECYQDGQRIDEIRVNLTQDGGVGNFQLKWHPEPDQKSPTDREIQGMNVFYEACKTTRTAMRPDQLRRLVCGLHKSVDQTFLREQIILEDQLPKRVTIEPFDPIS